MEVPYWGDACEIRDCVLKKGLDNCSYCRDFPCELLLDISLDPDTGDDGARLDTLRLMKDERTDEKIRPIRRTLLGCSIGVIAGFLLAGFTGGGLDWFFALAGGDYRAVPETPGGLWIYVLFGAASGTAVPWIIKLLKR
jgi:hypothetical protein